MTFPELSKERANFLFPSATQKNGRTGNMCPTCPAPFCHTLDNLTHSGAFHRKFRKSLFDFRENMLY